MRKRRTRAGNRQPELLLTFVSENRDRVLCEFGDQQKSLLEFIKPKKHCSQQGILCQIGEEMNIPFPFAKNESWCVDDEVFCRWLKKVALTYIGRRSAAKRPTGRPYGSIVLNPKPANSDESKKQRRKRANRRKRHDEMSAKYLAWYKDRYGGS